MNIVIVKYNAGNVASVQFALERLGIVASVSNDHDIIRNADKVIFPGVGEASSAMRSLKENNLDEVIAKLTQPVLGICLGMQLMCDFSEEGNTKCLGLFETQVRRIANPGEEGARLNDAVGQGMKIPHMGWNTIAGLKGKLYKGVPRNAYVYYVHGYCADICGDTTAVTEYIRPFSASLERDNFFGVQFHPEKSGVAGEFIIRNFIEL